MPVIATAEKTDSEKLFCEYCKTLVTPGQHSASDCKQIASLKERDVPTISLEPDEVLELIRDAESDGAASMNDRNVGLDGRSGEIYSWALKNKMP
jgi:hypothetical protein